MIRSRTLSRRRLLAGHATGAAFLLLAGCTDRGGTDAPDGEPATHGESPSTEGIEDEPASQEAAVNGTEGSDGDDLDLREANVVDVTVEAADGAYTFDVTLHHDDDGEEGYANWWQVERLDGTRLGRRDLLHAHSQQPFTRSETVEVPDDVACVVVRGHDRTHGYGGRAALVDVDSGTVRFVDQGSDPRSFDAADCP